MVKPPKSPQEEFPHPLGDNGRAHLLFAFERALGEGHSVKAAELEQFAQEDAELAGAMRVLRRDRDENFA